MASASAEAKHSAATQEQFLSSLVSQVRQLTTVIAQLAPPSSAFVPASLASTPASTRPVSEPRIRAPKHYAGEPEGCNPFLGNGSIFFVLHPLRFAAEETNVAFAIS